MTPKIWKVYVRKRKKGNGDAEVAWVSGEVARGERVVSVT